ncbi:MAG: NYN domain-containing protein [bacterium]|nr:NYN domain-containing protein [bacterium]
MRRYLIDGNNLLHTIATQGLGPPLGRETLCRRLAQWAEANEREVTVVFDGPEPPTAIAAQMRSGGLAVRFSGSGSADDVIIDRVSRDPRSGSLTVVTTDRSLGHAVRYHRARYIDAESFAKALLTSEAPPAPVPPTDRSDDKPGQVPDDEAEQWLQVFKDDRETDDQAG